MQQPEVAIYTTPTCTYCAAAKRWFQQHGVRYSEHDVSKDPARAAEMYRLTGQNAVPVIRVGSQVLVGFDPLQLARLIPSATLQPADTARPRLSLGMAAQSLTLETAQERGLPAAFGVLVGPVREGGPAALAGIEPGDVIIGVGDYTLQNLNQLTTLVAAKQPGDELTLRVWRDGAEREVVVRFPAATEPAATPEPAERAS